MAEYEIEESPKSESKPPSIKEMIDIPVSGGIISTPCIENGIIYVGGCDKYVYAVDSKDGHLIWKFLTGGVIWSSPAVQDGTVYIGSNDGYVYALDAETGELIWKFLTGAEINSSPVIVKDKIYLGSLDRHLYSLTKDGDLIWKFQTGGELSNTPAVCNNSVYFGSHDGKFYCVSADDGRLVWKFNTLTVLPIGSKGSPLITNSNFETLFDFSTRSLEKSPKAESGFIYFGCWDNNIYSISLDGDLRWKFLTGGTCALYGAMDNKKLYYPSLDGYLYCLTGDNGKLLWKSRTGGPIGNRPCIMQNLVYVGSWDGSLYAFDKEDGKVVWKFITGGEIFSTPRAYENTLFFGSNDTFLYAINASERSVIWRFQTGFGMKADVKQTINLLHEFDKKVFKVWRSEGSPPIPKDMLPTYKIPETWQAGMEYGGTHTYGMSAPSSYIAEGAYQSIKKRKPLHDPRI